jgi:hypothetical protein
MLFFALAIAILVVGAFGAALWVFHHDGLSEFIASARRDGIELRLRK